MDFDSLVGQLRATGHAVIRLEELDALADRAGYAPDADAPGRYRDAEGLIFDAWPDPAPVHRPPRRRRDRSVPFRDLI